ncbi:bacterio-opsin activator domain-containing protein [Halospeciosus flavus]|uniref:Bacterio-opsin activator domain-containing protein n=1 Tax=Halospeciosus flavus TaxID=3032283 RepID=A0ABD5Z3Z7_9EURY|nr:bacterio-opsin activator domain-containing protein [Halospeciosus flavus]
MTVIAEYTVSADDFALAETLEAVPEVVVEIERVVAHDVGQVTPYFWIRGDDDDAFADAIERDPTTQSVTRLDEYEDTTLYRAEWTQNIESIVYAYVDIGATILDAVGRADNWELRMRFDDEQHVRDFGDYCDRNDAPFTLHRLYHPSEPRTSGQYGLSTKQREALTIALERGYFDVPRSVSMEVLADDVDISQQSFSKRLRRAHRNLIANALPVDFAEDDTRL